MASNDRIGDTLLQYLDLPWYKGVLAISVGVFLSVFLIVFQPFGVTNYQREFAVNAGFLVRMLGVGVAVSTALAVSEFVLRPLVMKSLSWPHLYLWLAWDYLLVGTVAFLYYNHLGNWHDFRLSSYLGFLVDIASVITFPVIAVGVYLRHEALASRMLALSETPANPPSLQLVHFFADNEKDVHTVEAGQLLYIEAQDNYVEVVRLQDDMRQSELLRSSLKRIEAIAVPGLQRCHRSFLVNLDQVTACRGNHNGLKLTLRGVDRPIPVSRAHARRVMDRLGVAPGA